MQDRKAVRSQLAALGLQFHYTSVADPETQEAADSDEVATSDEHWGQVGKIVPYWHLKLLKVPIYRTWAVGREAENADTVRSESWATHGPADFALRYTSTCAISERRARQFRSRDAFEHFVSEVNARIEGMALGFEGEPGTFNEQLERHLSSSSHHRDAVNLVAETTDRSSYVKIKIAKYYVADPMASGKTYIDVYIGESDNDRARILANEVQVLLHKYSVQWKKRGAESKAPAIRAVDLHSQELEEFKTRLTRRTWAISLLVSVPLAVISLGVSVLLKVLGGST